MESLGLSAYHGPSPCEGLHAAHTAHDAEGNSLRIVHRDISAQNLIVGYDGLVRVLDFGFASASTIKGRSTIWRLSQCTDSPSTTAQALHLSPVVARPSAATMWHALQHVQRAALYTAVVLAGAVLTFLALR